MSWLCLLLFVVVCFNTGAQMRGQVVDSKTEEPIAKATLIARGDARLVTITDAFGMFFLTANAGDSIQVRCLGYQPVRFLADAAMAERVIRLMEAPKRLDDVFIFANLPDVDEVLKKAATRMTINFQAGSWKGRGTYCENISIDGQPAGFTASDVIFFSQGFQKRMTREKYRYLDFDWMQASRTMQDDYRLLRTSRGFMRQVLAPHEIIRPYRNFLYRGFLADDAKRREYGFRIVDIVTTNDANVLIEFVSRKKDSVGGTLRVSLVDYAPLDVVINFPIDTEPRIDKATELRVQKLKYQYKMQFRKILNHYEIVKADFLKIYRDCGFKMTDGCRVIEEVGNFQLVSSADCNFSEKELVDTFGGLARYDGFYFGALFFRDKRIQYGEVSNALCDCISPAMLADARAECEQNHGRTMFTYEQEQELRRQYQRPAR